MKLLNSTDNLIWLKLNGFNARNLEKKKPKERRITKNNNKRKIITKSKKLKNLKKLLKKNLKKLKKMTRKSKSLRLKIPLTYYLLPHSTFSISRPYLLMLLIKKKLLISYGKIMMLLDFLSGTSSTKDMKEKVLNYTLLLTLKTLLYKDLIHSENTFSDHSVFMEMKVTMKSEESGYGEELKFLTILKKISPTSNITIGLNLTTTTKLTENSLKNTGLEWILMYLLLMV